MFIKNITKVLEGLIYLLLGAVVSAIIIFFIYLPTDNLAAKIEHLTEISIFIIFILLPVPIMLNKYVNNQKRNALKQFLSNIVYMLKNTHIALGILLISLRILHVEVNLLCESIKWNMETISSILLSIFLIPMVIYAILRINNPDKYLIPHRLFLILTYLTFIIHLFH